MIRIVLKPSRLLASFVTSGHLVAGVMLVPLAMPLWAKSLILLAIAAGLAHRAVGFARSPIISIAIHDSTRATITLRDQRELPAAILETTYVSHWLTAVNLRVGDERLARHVLLLPDNVDADDFRRVRVALRWARGAGQAAPTPNAGSARSDAP